MSKVYKIEGKGSSPQPIKRIRVAAYARVSTEAKNQLSSLLAQENYYEKLIVGKSDWDLDGIYDDKGITGTSYIKRDEFNRMIADC